MPFTNPVWKFKYTLFELIGVHITRLEKENNHLVDEYSETPQSEPTDNGGVMTHISARNNESFVRHWRVLSFYSICFSVIKACTWNSQTLYAIVDHGNEFYPEQFTCPNENICLRKFPNKLQMYDATVDIVFTTQKEGIFSSASISSKLLLENFILKKCKRIYWISNMVLKLWCKLHISAQF